MSSGYLCFSPENDDQFIGKASRRHVCRVQPSTVPHDNFHTADELVYGRTEQFCGAANFALILGTVRLDGSDNGSDLRPPSQFLQRTKLCLGRPTNTRCLQEGSAFMVSAFDNPRFSV